MSEGIDLVSAALVSAQAEMEAATFDMKNPYFKTSYASLGAVIQASRAALAKHGLAVQQVPEIVNGQLSLKTVIRHKSGQTLDGGKIEVTLSEDKGNSLEQSAGKKFTYFRRYAWASNLGIYADQDDDGEPEDRETKPQAKIEPKATPKPIATGEPTPAFRLRALNRLQAAPGQSNRGLVSDFFISKGWIKREQFVEDWPLSHVPKTVEELTALSEEIQRFGMQQAQSQPYSETP